MSACPRPFHPDLIPEIYSQTKLLKWLHSVRSCLIESCGPVCTDLSVCLPQVSISISSVGFVPLYGTSDKHKILALFAPSDPFTAVGLYLLGRWWTVEDILRTADPSRAGAVEVWGALYPLKYSPFILITFITGITERGENRERRAERDQLSS